MAPSLCLVADCWMAHCGDGLDPVPNSFLSSPQPPVSPCLSLPPLIYTCQRSKHTNTGNAAIKSLWSSSVFVAVLRVYPGLRYLGYPVVVWRQILANCCVNEEQSKWKLGQYPGGLETVVWICCSSMQICSASPQPVETKERGGWIGALVCVEWRGVEGGRGGGWRLRPELRLAAVGSLT